MITKLSFNNFKSWKSTGEVRLAPITCLFGPNSSGKTSFIQLLLMLKQTTESSDRSQVLNLGSERSLVELGTFRDILYRHRQDLTLSFSLEWKHKKKLNIIDIEQEDKILFSGETLSFQSEIEDGSTGSLAVKKLTYGLDSHYFGIGRLIETSSGKFDLFSDKSFHFIRKKGRAWPLPPPVKCYGFPDQVTAYYQNAGFLADFELAFEELFSRVYYLGPLREYPKRQYTWANNTPYDMGRRGERVVDALLAAKQNTQLLSFGKGKKRLRVDEYVAHWLCELALVHDFSVAPLAVGSNVYQVLVQQTKGGAWVPLTDVGFGVSQILPVLTLCYYVPEGSTIIMEQPEIHLHPTVQAGLADLFIDAAEKRNIQIIVESHSEYLVRRLQRRIAEEVISTEKAALYFCELHKGSSRLNSLKIDEYGNITNWPEGFFGDDFIEMAAMSEAQLKRKMQRTPQEALQEIPSGE